MALKKSELYSSLWASCDELRGGMDASQYKDYVLVMLFVKYVSDKYAGVAYASITIPEGASFKDMVALKGTSDIGDQINKKIIAPLAAANKLSDMPDFNDATKLGTGKEMVERLTNLIAIFENPGLDFSKNRAEGDDILGDAYEYLMRHFATESGKSKGQFYTPAEVSRIMAQISGIHDADTTNATTVYDPTCGSGSLLLKVSNEAKTEVTLYGQDKDNVVAGLARMNMILHNNSTALIHGGHSTLANPYFTENGKLKTFDYVVANPPFSDKRWSTGLDVLNDPHERFKHFGVPPAKQGDYAYLLHIVRSLKSKGKGACILPHGVLFRGNVEADIRRNLIRRGYIKGIIGLPANLFYGTGIPACIVVIDKEGASARKGIFMIDASKGFMKDGPKNRLRDMDIHKIVDVFTKQTELPKYARMVSFDKIEKNEFNLNIPRYIDSQEAEDIQDIEGHLRGGIPVADLDGLEAYWEVCPTLRKTLFRELRPGYRSLIVEKSAIKSTIYEHEEFASFMADMEALFDDWRDEAAATLKALELDCHPKAVIADLSEDLLDHYAGKPLIENYDVYQHLMDYWADTMQDDCYLIAADGWKAEPYRVIETDKKGKEKDKGWACDLVPKSLMVARYFSEEQVEIDALKAELDSISAQMTELEEEHGSDAGALSSVNNKSEAEAARREVLSDIWRSTQPDNFSAYSNALTELETDETLLSELKSNPLIQSHANSNGNITQPIIKKRLKIASDEGERELWELLKNTTTTVASAKKTNKTLWAEAMTAITLRIQVEPEHEDHVDILIIDKFLELTDQISNTKSDLKQARADLDAKALAKYPALSEEEIKILVVEDKWLTTLADNIHGEMDRISQALDQRVKVLAERYETPLPDASNNVAVLEDKVDNHLLKMGFSWK